jgi:signal transduction histidine kinase
MGVYVTYRKAASRLQETARQNLTESAVRKGHNIQESIKNLQINLLIASETTAIKLGTSQESQQFLEQLAAQLPTQESCLELTDLFSQKNTASTCQHKIINNSNRRLWLQHQKKHLSQNKIITNVATIKNFNINNNSNQSISRNQINFILSAPVYGKNGNLRSVLSIQSALILQDKAQPGSLSGYTVVISQDGTILAHPLAKFVGRNIDQDEDAERLRGAVKNALAGNNYFQHLSSFEEKGGELLAGYTAIPSPVTSQGNKKWIILAVQSRKNALFDLIEIWQLLFVITLCLIVACLLATLYIARELSRPVEKLRDYAKEKQHLLSIDQVPNNFKIREFHELAEALNSMVDRLKTGAAEIQTAWKEAQTANQLKNEFLATTSHELRTPLNGIIGCIRLVKDGYCDDREEELELLQRADEAAIHLLEIINDILDLAKIESGKMALKLEPVDLNKLLKEVIDLQKVSIKQKNLEMKNYECQNAIAVNANPAKLKQVLLNVIGNAVKFTDTGSINITTHINESPQKLNGVKASGNNAKTENKSFVVVTVQDTGIGINPEQQHKLFRSFVMVDGSTTRKFGGTGLGLAISRKLLELMGGEITLFSEGEGKGTTVEITLSIVNSQLLLSRLNGNGIVNPVIK